LLYTRSMGEKEQAFITLGFPRVTVFRPGMLHREGTERALEKLIVGVCTALPTSTLARAMIYDAESTPPNLQTPEFPVIYTGNTEIPALANSASSGSK